MLNGEAPRVTLARMGRVGDPADPRSQQPRGPAGRPSEGPIPSASTATHGRQDAPSGQRPAQSRGMRAYVMDGWLLGGAALGFVLEHRALKRFMLIAAAIV